MCCAASNHRANVARVIELVNRSKQAVYIMGWRSRQFIYLCALLQCTVVRVSQGLVTGIGFAALLRAASDLHSVQGLDFANELLADARCYGSLLHSFQAGRLGHILMLRLTHMHLNDNHVEALARALGGLPNLETLSVAGNKWAFIHTRRMVPM
jgi:hypothetical protein